jgi:hypothetical protein
VKRVVALIAVATLAGCSHRGASRGAAVVEPRSPLGFLVGRTRPLEDDANGPLVAVTDPTSGRVAVYDSALVALVLLRRGERDRAGRVLAGLARLQLADGSVPFSFVLPSPGPYAAYVRSGAVAWVGYAAAEYLDAEAGGPSREVVRRLAHRAADYLLSLQVDDPSDLRDGLVLGGSGQVHHEVDATGEVRERVEPGPVAWASVEHNVDAFFFLRALARVTDMRVYADAAARIARALSEQAWDGDARQLVRGVGQRGRDEARSLDCASWGSVFFVATGDRARAMAAFRTADGPAYASRDPRSGAEGHRAYASGPLLDEPQLARRFAASLPAQNWDRLEAVWPEGSAGVALAALRLGDVARARAIVEALEPLRGPDGALPTSTVEVPFVFDTRAGIAGTAWVELVRFELDRAGSTPTFWAGGP